MIIQLRMKLARGRTFYFHLQKKKVVLKAKLPFHNDYQESVKAAEIMSSEVSLKNLGCFIWD